MYLPHSASESKPGVSLRQCYLHLCYCRIAFFLAITGGFAKFQSESQSYNIMKKSTILSVMATVAMLPVVVAQEPAPSVPEGVMVTTRAFINGKEVPPAEFEKMMKEMRARMMFGYAPGKVAPELPPVPPAPAPEPAPEPAPVAAPEAAPCCPNPDCTCGPAPKPCECKPGAVCAPKTATEPTPEPPPAPEPEPAPAVAPEAAPCCPNPDCTCGPAPKPCECKPGAVCGAKVAAEPAAEPAPEPAAEPAPAPEPAVEVVKPAAGTVRVIVNGREIKPVLTRVVPATKLHPAKPACPSCGKKVPRRPMPGDMPPCGKARPFDTPAYGTTPPCVRTHGKIMPPSVRMQGVRRGCPGAPIHVRRGAVRPGTSPQAVRVIINGVETIVPVVPEGVNITIKPL